MKQTASLVLTLVAAAALGAGCLDTPTSQQVATTFTNPTLTAPIPARQGFGELPKIKIPTGRAKVTLAKDLPNLPPEITVLRLRKGTPDDTQLRNMTNALGIPAQMLGNFPQTAEMNLEWNDGQGFKWNYRASERTLEFKSTATSGPLTLSELKPYADVMATADTFIFARGLRGMYYRQGLVRPDWYSWWTDAINRKLCMDRGTVNTVRALAASSALVSGTLPQLVASSGGICVRPEFPSRQAVAYRALIDQQDVVRSDGSYLDGAEIVVDTSQNTVTEGRLNMYYDPERSDYPALSKEKVEALLLSGGISGASGDITLTEFDFVLLRVDDASARPTDAYLIPSILGQGTRMLPDGTSAPFKIVAPLLAQ